jgi:hypothetical protein
MTNGLLASKDRSDSPTKVVMDACRVSDDLERAVDDDQTGPDHGSSPADDAGIHVHRRRAPTATSFTKR